MQPAQCMTIALLVETVLWGEVGTGRAVDHPGQVAGRVTGNTVRIQDRHLAAPLSQGPGGGGASEPGTDYQNLSGRPLWPGRVAFNPANQHMSFVAEAVAFFHGKARLRQPAADKAGGSKGCQGGTGAAQSGQLGEQFRLPHVRVAGRGKAVQKPGIHRMGELWPQRQGIAVKQGQLHTGVQLHTVKARRRRGILCQQPLCQGVQGWPVAQGPAQVRFA